MEGDAAHFEGGSAFGAQRLEKILESARNRKRARRARKAHKAHKAKKIG